MPDLLDGMKLAFSTSIAGLTTSTLLKITHTLVVSISDDDPWSSEDDALVVKPSDVHVHPIVQAAWEPLVKMDRADFDRLLDRLKKLRELMSFE